MFLRNSEDPKLYDYYYLSLSAQF